MIGRLLSSLSVVCLASSASAFAPSAHQGAGSSALRVSLPKPSCVPSMPASPHEQLIWPCAMLWDREVDTHKDPLFIIETHRSLPSTSSYHAVEMLARPLHAVPWAATSRWRPSQKSRSRNSTARALGSACSERGGTTSTSRTSSTESR